MIIEVQMKIGSHDITSRVFKFKMKLENIRAGVNSYSIIIDSFFSSYLNSTFLNAKMIPQIETISISDVHFKTACMISSLYSDIFYLN